MFRFPLAGPIEQGRCQSEISAEVGAHRSPGAVLDKLYERASDNLSDRMSGADERT
jgi:hypothetical protein